MARTRSLSLKKSRGELNRLLKLSRKLAKNISKAVKTLDRDEKGAVALSDKKNDALAARLKKKAKKALKLARAKNLKKLRKAIRLQAKKAGAKGRLKRAGRGTARKGKATRGRKAAKPGRKAASRGTRQAWTASQISKMRKMLVAGLKVSQVAAKLKRQPGAIRQRLVQEGISLRALKKASGSKKTKAPKAAKSARGSKGPRKTKAAARSERPDPTVKLEPAKDLFFVNPEKTKKV